MVLQQATSVEKHDKTAEGTGRSSLIAPISNRTKSHICNVFLDGAPLWTTAGRLYLALSCILVNRTGSIVQQMISQVRTGEFTRIALVQNRSGQENDIATLKNSINWQRV